ncbi:ABC transporter permease [Sodalis sp. RH21]|uniref:ABC transporter permease n=1 Tax=unclassified Sodalis (in: enterobacteria) TaxID=2636512 RepID=UPI0039B6373B
MLEALGFGEHGWGGMLLLAALTTVALTLAALLVGAAFGALVAAARLSRRRVLRWLGEGYSVVFRGIPELLIIYLFYFGGSGLLTLIGQAFGADGYIEVPAFLIGALAIGMISGSYQGEVYRGAVMAIAPGELEAGYAMGMTRTGVLRRILFPQVLRFSLPGLANVWQMSLKDSALVSVTGIVELLRASQVAAGSTRHYFTFYIIGGACYLVLTGLSNHVFNRAERRLGRAGKTHFAAR